jgi:hypothetical protein
MSSTIKFLRGQAKMKNLLKIVAVLGVALLLSVAALGQAISGDMNGTVKDQSGAVVANATVDITNLATGFKQTTKANTSGEYHFVNLPAGHYSVQGSAPGLKGGFADIEVTLNKVATANITTNVAGTATTVEVSEAGATIDTTTATIGTTFESHEIADSPTTSTGSGVLNLSLLNAGVASSGGVGVGSGPVVSGQRPRNNNFTIEGVDNNSLSVTGPLIQIPNDAVDNFTVLQNDFSAEFGHSSGGQFNQTIKSGSNQFHGKAYEYFINRNLNAVDSQYALSQGGGNVSNPRYDNNRYGGSFGGPIIKNKLFFFTDWEYNTIGQAGSASTACAPTTAGYAQLASLFPNNNQLQTMQKYLPAGGAANVCPSFITVAPGIPSANFGTKGVTTYNVPTGDVGFSGPSFQNYLNTANSFDWNISQNDQLRGRLAWTKQDGFDTAAQEPSFWITLPTRYWLVTLSEYHNFSPNVNNEFRFGFNRFANQTPTGSQTYPGLNTFPNLTIYELNGVNIGPDGNAPQGTIQNSYQGVDNVSWVKGRHSLRFGAEFRWYVSPQTFTQRVRGDYQWGSTSDFLNDFYPDPGNLGANGGDFAERSAGNIVYYGNKKAFYTYANDEFRLTPKLTLNFGLRYEWTGEPLGVTSLQPLNAISSVPGLISFTAPTSQKGNILPRIGFAYAPEPNTSIRGGFTMANDVLFDNLGILSNPPQVQQTCDTQTVVLGSDPRTPSCNWSLTNFLANGGLPNTLAVITDPAAARGATGGYVPNQTLPYSESWNLGVQHMFGNKYTLEVRYVGTKGIHLPVQTRLNKTSPIGPNSYLPTYLAAPSQSVLDSLPYSVKCPAEGCAPGVTNLNQSVNSYVPAYLNAGFTGAVVAFEPYGYSNYNGLQTQFTRNFTNGLQFQAAWTWSHMFDNSTAEVFSTVLTPRRPQNFACWKCDYSTSAYDRRHRITVQVLYDLPFYKGSSNWMLKNVVGNWQFTPIYTFQSPEYATVQSGVDANLNGDNAGDRAIYNPAGVAGTGSGVTALKNTNGDTVAYIANNPTAQYIVAGSGALATAARNTLSTPHINNWDFSILKRVNITERQALEFNFQATNIFNHAQYVPGFISDVQPATGYTSGETRNFLIPNSPTFNNPQAVFSNHPRVVVLVMKYIF